MPVDLELFLSQTGASLFDYSPFLDNITFSRSHILIPKPCFVKKSYSEISNKRKKVSFADDKGFRLAEIREIPPVLPAAPIINDVQKCWKIASKNPPWTDSKLIELLETNKVALESATTKTTFDKMLKYKWSNNFRPASSSNNENILQGIIKVKNLSYEKTVFARITFDRWLSSVDIKATHLKLEGEYDNFTFVIDIPSSAFKYEVIEFCVGYFCNHKQYWDNNGGINYRLTTEVLQNKIVEQRYPQKSNDSITLSFTEDIERFSEIDSWSNFINNQPYW